MGEQEAMRILKIQLCKNELTNERVGKVCIFPLLLTCPRGEPFWGVQTLKRSFIITNENIRKIANLRENGWCSKNKQGEGF